MLGRWLGLRRGCCSLGSPLLAGVPAAGMQVSPMAGFVDREGGSFFQEWSGLFCMDGEQGDRVLYYYPRLQAMQGSAETAEVLAGAAGAVAAGGGVSCAAGGGCERWGDGGVFPELFAGVMGRFVVVQPTSQRRDVGHPDLWSFETPRQAKKPA